MQIKLKPCPFCGGVAELDTQQPYRNIATGALESGIAVYCTACDAHMMVCRADVADVHAGQVVEAWNRRCAHLAIDEVVTESHQNMFRSVFGTQSFQAPVPSYTVAAPPVRTPEEILAGINSAIAAIKPFDIYEDLARELNKPYQGDFAVSSKRRMGLDPAFMAPYGKAHTNLIQGGLANFYRDQTIKSGLVLHEDEVCLGEITTDGQRYAILASPRKPAPKPHDWTAHTGGPCPVRHEEVEVLLRSDGAQRVKRCWPEDVNWHWERAALRNEFSPIDVLYWRTLVEEHKPEDEDQDALTFTSADDSAQYDDELLPELCSYHGEEQPCSTCAEEHEQMRIDDNNGYINRG